MYDEAVLIALGSNQSGRFGSSNALLVAALEGFASVGLEVAGRSSWWRSASWPDPSLPDYLNGVAMVEPTLPPDWTGVDWTRAGSLSASGGRLGRPNGEPTVCSWASVLVQSS